MFTRTLFVLLLALSLTNMAIADESSFALGGGIMLNYPDTDADLDSGVDEEISASLNIGARALVKINDQWSFRTGLYLQEKSAKFSVESGILDGDLSVRVISAAIPLNMQVRVNENFAFFGGYSADFKINEYCTTGGDFDECSLLKDAESVVHNLMIGTSIKGNDKLDIDISYQHGLTDMMEDIKVHSLMAQMFYKF